jgi:hypothetical protein
VILLATLTFSGNDALFADKQAVCAADPPVALSAPCRGDVQSHRGPRTLLTVALSLKDISLVKAVLRTLVAVVDGKPTAHPGGLPYYSAVDIQVSQLGAQSARNAT